MRFTGHYATREKMLTTRNRQRSRYYSRSATGSRRQWTEAELQLIMDRSLSDRIIARILNRSISSIQAARKRQNCIIRRGT